ncbi:YceI family protein [Salegentibacter sp. F188]|uniref:YceI family protein n=1 Tax=Autumnicola patrickiae TaxID=3075591 RepID=A0ABU3E0L6_9FLAO|nr:YceI family protein [Salegentibacter sp. F188]MDT0689531.1 YceI family protein [Salegentibacter sp. F188]
MKTNFLNTFVFAFLALSIVGCKNEKNNEVEVSEAKEAAVAQGEVVEYKVDTSATVIEWAGSKPTGTHTGTIKVSEGTFSANDSIVESGNFTIDMVTIDVTDLEGEDKENLEAHLKGTVEGKEGDFFNILKYPEATFEVTGISEKDGQKMMEGNLTIKEETKNISFPVSINRSGDEIEITSETFTIDRTDWSVNYGSKSVFDNLGDNFVSDDIELKIELKATKA